MKRRNFLQTAGAMLSLSTVSSSGFASVARNKLIRPKALRPGDTVGLITTGTPVDDKRLANAEQRVKELGLRTKVGKNVAKALGSDDIPVQAKLDDLHAMFLDREVQAIIPVRGGYGSVELLDRIDYDLIRRHPKVFLGFSDITALHLAIHRHSRLVTFHGPNASYYPSEYTSSYLRKALLDEQPIGRVSNPTAPADPKFPGYKIRTIRPGTASGRLIGGNLTSVSYTMGTPYEIETRGSILFLEAEGEEPYHVRRILNQLRLAKKLDGVAGVVFGMCVDCVIPAGKAPYANTNYSTDEVLDYMLGKLNVPVLSGLAIGHSPDQITLPLGAMATLNADTGSLTITEHGVTR
jgi:muramoyltetrapeptide carboxypeptidase